MLVRGVLGTAGVGMRHPDRRYAEHVGEQIVADRAAHLRDHRWRLPAVRSMDSAHAQRPRIVRLGAAGLEPGGVASRRLADFDLSKPCLSRCLRRAGRIVIDIGARDVAQLAMRPGARRDRVDRAFRARPSRGQHGEGVPGVEVLGGDRPGSPQSGRARDRSGRRRARCPSAARDHRRCGSGGRHSGTMICPSG